MERILIQPDVEKINLYITREYSKTKHKYKHKYSRSKRDEEAIQLAHEALELSKQLDRIESRERITPTRSKSKIKKSSSTNIKSKKTSPYLRQRSKSVPPKKRKSSITVDPYRAPPSGSRDRDGPIWRPLTRMEEYTGRGLYTRISKPKEKLAPSKFTPTKQAAQVTPKTVKQLTSFDFNKTTKVRSVAEILEQTKIMINPRAGNEPEVEPEVGRDYGRDKDVYDPVNDRPSHFTRSHSLESGLNSLLDEIDKDHAIYCKPEVHETGSVVHIESDFSIDDQFLAR